MTYEAMETWRRKAIRLEGELHFEKNCNILLNNKIYELHTQIEILENKYKELGKIQHHTQIHIEKLKNILKNKNIDYHITLLERKNND